MSELLIELFSEEIPARMQLQAAETFGQLVTDRLTAAGLSFTDREVHSTPRRLVLRVTGLPRQQPDRREERKGPKVGAPTPAIEGFLRAAGLSDISQAEQRETDKGQFYFAVNAIKGQATAALLSSLVVDAIQALSWPKSMRWGRGQFRWVRPLTNLLVLFDGQIVEGHLPLADATEPGAGALTFGNVARGHRFLGPNPFKVSDFDNYVRKLADQCVKLRRSDREQAIRQGLAQLAAAEGLTLIEDAALMAEVVGLVEHPVPLMGTIDDSFMALPARVLTTSMREHQKFFAFTDAQGQLANRFATVANTIPQDGGRMIRAGNERVLRARLADAVFFWANDRERPLASLRPQLDKIVFHEKLGSLGARVDRLAAVAGGIARRIGADSSAVARAALLAKCDLVTDMVREFPELQGYVGSEIARHQGESPEVQQAIASHYAPLGPSDSVPGAPVAIALALAEKLDTLVGFWLIDQKPTGSKDPFALRRAALGVIRLLSENQLDLSFAELQALALDAYGAPRDQQLDLWGFIRDRLAVQLRTEGLRHDVVAALLGASGGDSVTVLRAEAAALQAFLAGTEGAALLASYRRGANLLAAEAKKAKGGLGALSLDPARFEPNDQALAEALARCRAELSARDFAGRLSAFAALRDPLDRYFDATLINADDPAVRRNRLALLALVGDLAASIADLSQIEGG